VRSGEEGTRTAAGLPFEDLGKEVSSVDVEGLGLVREDLQGRPKKKKPLEVALKFEKHDYGDCAFCGEHIDFESGLKGGVRCPKCGRVVREDGKKYGKNFEKGGPGSGRHPENVAGRTDDLESQLAGHKADFKAGKIDLPTYTSRVNPIYALRQRTQHFSGDTTSKVPIPFKDKMTKATKWHRRIDEENIVEKGGAGSGNWEGPGDPRYAHQGTGRPAQDVAFNTANEYASSAGLDPITPSPVVKVNPENGKRISDAYDAMVSNPDDPKVKSAYAALGREVDAQFKTLPVKVEFTSTDPYKSSQEMFDDVDNNNHLKVFTGGDPNPLLGTKDAIGISLNDKFRAVHDYYGHSMVRHQFGPSGEENAWIEHSKMFSPEAQRAMTTETRGQNSWFNFSSQNAGKKPSERSFAEQKVGILPDEFLPVKARTVTKFIKGGQGSGSWEGPGQPRFPHAGNKAFSESFHSGTHVQQFLKTNNVIIATTDKEGLSSEKKELRNKELEQYLQDGKIPYKKGYSKFDEWGTEAAYIIDAPSKEQSAKLQDMFYRKYKQDAVLVVRNGHVTGEYTNGLTKHGNVDKLESHEDLTNDYFSADGIKFRFDLK
jgi:hypothetical protein